MYIINDVDHIQEDKHNQKNDLLEDFIWQYDWVTNEFSNITGRTQEDGIRRTNPSNGYMSIK